MLRKWGNMTEPFKSLSELERDALAELSNIAMARAASSLRKMVDHEVALSVPSVEILTHDAAISQARLRASSDQLDFWPR